MNDQTKSPAAVKMVKVKTIRDIRVMQSGEMKIVPPHKEVSITEEEAKQFCDEKYPLSYTGWGEGHYDQHQMARAIRL